MNKKSFSALFVTTVLGMLLPSLALSVEVCDSENGAAYGLCNAYCEAMECDSGEPNASDIACQKVADKFQQIENRPVPCDCPMSNDPEFIKLVTIDNTVTSCVIGEYGSHPITQRMSLSVYGEALFSGVWYSGYEAHAGTTNVGYPEISQLQYDTCETLLKAAAERDNIDCM